MRRHDHPKDPRAVVLVALLLVVASAMADLGEKEQIQFADGIFVRGIYDMAIQEYEAFIQAFPESTRREVAYYRIGESHRKLRDPDAARKAYQQVFSLFPKGEYGQRAGLRLGEMLLDGGHHEAAVTVLSRLVETATRKDIAASGAYFLGHSLLKRGMKAEAEKAFEKVVETYPDEDVYCVACLALGGLYAKQEGRHERAAELLRKAAANPATDRAGAEALFQLAVVHFRRKSFVKSAEAYALLVARYPKDTRATESVLQGAWAYHHSGLYAKALQIAEGVFTVKPGPAGKKRAEWLYLKANCERQLLKHKEAASTYGRLLTDLPGSAYANAAAYEKALSHFKAGHYRAAVVQLRQVTLAPEQKKDAYWLFAESYAALDQRDEAIQYYRLIVEQYPDSDFSVDANYRVAHLLKASGNLTEAASRYEAVARDFPEHELAARSLFSAALCLAQSGEHDKAARDYDALLRTYPKSDLVERALYEKAMSQITLRRDRQARLSLRELLDKFPKTEFRGETHYWTGLLLKEEGKLEESAAELQKALALKPRQELLLEGKLQLAAVLHKLEKYDESADYLQALLQTPVRNKIVLPLLEWLTEYRLGKNQFDQAVLAGDLVIKTAETAVRKQVGWHLLATALAGQGRDDKAVAAYEKALVACPSTEISARAALRLGEFGLKAGNHDGARKYFEQASKLASDLDLLAIRTDAYVGLGRTAKAVGDLDAAARFFMSVAVLFDNPEIVPECLYEAAAAFEKLGRDKDRKNTLRELLERYPESKWAKKLETSE